jgi:hypothetical protein
MSGLEHVSEHLVKQYTGIYGPFVSGDYAIGQELHGAGVQGDVIWSYQSAHGLVYVIDDHSGWPVEIKAHEVQS